MARPLALLLSLAAFGCATTAPHSPTPIADADYPGNLRSPGTLSGDFMWRQQIRAEWPGGASDFEAVLQKRGDTLTLVGMNPLGQVGFVITQTGPTVEVEVRGGPALPFPACFILLDVQRVYFPWLPNGTLRANLDGEEVVETWEDGACRRRTFRRLDGVPAGLITVTLGAGTAPQDASIENGWFGYRLQIETLTHQPLPASSP